MAEMPRRIVRVAFKPADATAEALRATVTAIATHLHFSDEAGLSGVLTQCAKLLPLLITAQTLQGVVVHSAPATVPIMLDYELDPGALDEVEVGELELLEAQVERLELLFLVEDGELAAAIGADALPQLGTETVVISLMTPTPTA